MRDAPGTPDKKPPAKATPPPTHRGTFAGVPAAAKEGPPMMITMLIAFTIGDQNFERREPMPNLAMCWQRAPERMTALLTAHPEMTKLAVGCVISNGDPI
jgi:hypothetical protein